MDVKEFYYVANFLFTAQMILSVSMFGAARWDCFTIVEPKMVASRLPCSATGVGAHNQASCATSLDLSIS